MVSIIILEGEEMKKRCNLLWALLLALSLMALPGMAGADMTWWEGGDGNWSDLNWNPRVPIEGDQAIIGGDGNDSFIVLDIDTPVLSGLRIDAENAKLVLDQSSNTMRIGTGGELVISSNGYDQSTYTLSGGTLELGEGTGLILKGHGDVDMATFNLSGSGVLVKKSFEVKIGADSNTAGHFYQDGGSFQLNGAMYVGDWGNGRYTLLDGEITGYYGTLAGELSDSMHYGGIVLGEWGGTGLFNQTGGMVAINDLSLARQTGSTGEYFLSGNASLEVMDVAKIGEKGMGIFTQDGSSYFRAREVWVGVFQTGTGEFILNNGGLSTDCLIIGGKDGADEPGTGSFYQYSGTVETGGMWIGDTQGSVGAYNLEGGDLNVIYYDVIGMRGTGVFNQNGGNHTANWDLEIGGSDTGFGTYNFSGGSLSSTNTFVGNYGTGEFNQTGGVHSVGGELIVARFEGSRGRYMLSGDGELYADRVIVGDAGYNRASVGYFHQSGNSRHEIGQDLIVGQDSMSLGTFTLSDDARLTVQGNIYIGDEGGTGIFIQSGNSELSVNDLFISSASESGGSNPGNGTFVMEGGTLNANAIFNNGFFTGTAGFGNITVANGFYNTGIVAPGQSPGTLTIDGDFIQDPVGTLLIELGGYNPGVDSDLLEITGYAFLDGRLEVSLWNGFTPADGDEFDILRAGEIVGGFDLNSLVFPKSWSWQIAYLDLDSNNTYDTVRLTANSVPVPAAIWLFASGLIGLVSIRRNRA